MTSPFFNFVNPFAIPQTAIPRRNAQPNEDDEELLQSYLMPQQSQQHPLQQFVLRPEAAPVSSAPRCIYPVSSIPHQQRPVIRRAAPHANSAIPRFSEDEQPILFLKPQPKRTVHPLTVLHPAVEPRGRPQMIRILPVVQQPLAQARRLNPEDEDEEADEVEAAEIPPQLLPEENVEVVENEGELTNTLQMEADTRPHLARRHTSMEDVDDDEEEETNYGQQQEAPTPTTRFINNLILEAAKQKQFQERKQKGQFHQPAATAQRHQPVLFEMEPSTPSESEKQKLLEDLLFQSQPRRQRIVPQQQPHHATQNEILGEILAQALQQQQQGETQEQLEHEERDEYPEEEPVTPNTALENPQEEEEVPPAVLGHKKSTMTPQEQLLRILQQAEAQKELEKRQKAEQMRYIHPQRLQDQRLPTLQDLLQEQLKQAYDEQEQEGKQQHPHHHTQQIPHLRQQQPSEEDEEVEMKPLFFQYPPRAHQTAAMRPNQRQALESEHPHANPFFNVYIPSEHNPLAKPKHAPAKQQASKQHPSQVPQTQPQEKPHAQSQPQQQPSSKPAQQPSENDRILKKIEDITTVIEEYFFEVIQLSEDISSKQFALVDNPSLQLAPRELETIKRGVEKLDGLYTSQMIALDEIQSDDEEVRRKRKACVTKIQKILKSIDLLQHRVSDGKFQARLKPESPPQSEEAPKQEAAIAPKETALASGEKANAELQVTTIDIPAQDLSSTLSNEQQAEQTAKTQEHVEKQTTA